jgi:hypothetical protein
MIWSIHPWSGKFLQALVCGNPYRSKALNKNSRNDVNSKASYLVEEKPGDVLSSQESTPFRRKEAQLVLGEEARTL